MCTVQHTHISCNKQRTLIIKEYISSECYVFTFHSTYFLSLMCYFYTIRSFMFLNKSDYKHYNISLIYRLISINPYIYKFKLLSKHLQEGNPTNRTVLSGETQGPTRWVILRGSVGELQTVTHCIPEYVVCYNISPCY